jgi:hypothetical protein
VTPFVAETAPPISDVITVPAGEIDALLSSEVDFGVSSIKPSPNRRHLLIATIQLSLLGTHERISGQPSPSRFEFESLGDEVVIAPSGGVITSARRALAELSSPPLLLEVATGSVAQALAAAGHGFALVAEPVRFGLAAARAFAHDKPLLHSLYASWDSDHYAVAELGSLAISIREWVVQHGLANTAEFSHS